jgi:hypothetical protein
MMRATMAASLLPERWEALLQSLSGPCREAFTAQPLPEWVSTLQVAEMVDRYNALTRSDTANVRAILLMDRLIGGQPELVARRSPRAALETVLQLFPRHHRGGVLELESAGEGQALVRLWATIPYPHYLSMFVPSALKRAIEICGAEEAVVIHREPEPAGCAYLHRYELTWKLRA